MWVKDGTLKSVLETLAEDLHRRGELDLSECFIDGTFVSAKKGASKLERPSGAKVRRSWQCAIGAGFPVAIYTDSASPHKIKFVGKTLAEVFTRQLPERLIGDKAYDSDPLDAELSEQGVEMIAPHKRNRKKSATQDGRKLRRYKRR